MPGATRFTHHSSIGPRSTLHNVFVVRASLAAMIVAFAAYVSFETIAQHQMLETRAFDLGVFDSVFWNTSQGRLFWSPLLLQSHLGQHSSLILIVLAPVYSLVPRPETLLVSQAILLGMAAWPLFLIARVLLGSELQALVVAALYLIHPAIGGAAFYDFHELAFAPVLFFAAYLFHLLDRRVLLAIAVGLLLLVKEDLSLVVIGFGLSCLFERRWRRGAALIAAGVAGYVVFVHFLIPYFAPPNQSFGWYFEDLVPAGQPPSAVVGAVINDPLKVVGLALQPGKIVYLVKLLGPLCFVPFLTLQGAVLMGYGLAMSALASRPPVFTVGFQYALHVVPYAFVAALIALARLWPPSGLRFGVRRRDALAVVALASAIFCFVYGMIGLRTHFQGGFRRVVFSASPEANERYQEVKEMAARIPPGDSVTASERLVPHVSARRSLQTLRYATGDHGAEYDTFFVLKSELEEWTQQFPYVFRETSYRRVADGTYTVLYRKR